MKANRNIPLVTLFVLFIVFAFAASMPDKSNQHRFKNLKVLPKDITDEALDKVMDSFNFSLGVKCNFCHATADTGRHLDFASDAKEEKGIARKMMRMTADINKKYFNFNKDAEVPKIVGCVTCHRKNPIPPVDTVPVRRHG